KKYFHACGFRVNVSGQNAGICRKKTENVTVRVTKFGMGFTRIRSRDFSDRYFKCGKTRSFLTESVFRGEALKGRSEGSWRSGRRRSGDVGGGGTVNVFVCSVSCRFFLEHTVCHRSAASLESVVAVE